MPFSIAKLIVDIGANLSDFNSGLNAADTGLSRFASKALVRGAVLTTAVTVPATLAASQMLRVGMAYEQSQIAFTHMLGSAERATRFLGELKDFSKQTPFEFMELQDAARRIMAMGFSAESVLPMMRDIGDAVSGLGLGSDGVNRVVIALGQMKGKAKVSAQEMMQLTEAGIPAWEYLAKAVGASTAKTMELAERGLIPADKALQAILEGMRQDFGGMMAAQSETAAGQLSNLRDELTELAGDLAGVMLPTVKDLVAAGRKALQTFNAMPEWTKRAVIGFGALAVVAGPVMIGIGGVASGLQAMMIFGSKALPVLKGVGAAFQLMQGAGGVGKAFSVMKLGMAGISAVAIPAALAIGAVTLAYNEFITKTVTEGRKNVSGAWTKFFDDQVKAGKSATEILNEYKSAQDRVQKTLDDAGLLKIFMGDTEQLKGDVDGLSSALLTTSTSYAEYLELIQRSGEPITAVTQAEWDMAHAVEKMGIAAQSAATDGLAQVLSGAEKTKGQLEGLIGVVDSISGEMREWTTGAASSMVSALQNRLPEGSQKFADGLGIVDEVMRTNYLGQMKFNDSVKSLVDQYARTGDLSAFRDGLVEIKEKGLADMQKSLEDATTKAQDLYDQLLSLPEDIRIKINLDIEELPSWLAAAGGKTNKTASETSYKPEALGGPVWAGERYWVGERGPEPFTPAQNGRITPAGKSGGMALYNYGMVMVGAGDSFGLALEGMVV